MTPAELALYLNVIKASGLAITRFELLPGGGVRIESVGTVGEGSRSTEPLPQVLQDMAELFPGGIRPSVG